MRVRTLTWDRSDWERAPGRADHECPNLVTSELPLSAYQLLQDGDDESEGFPRACHGFYNDVLMAHEERNGGGLDGGHLGVTHGVDNI